MCDAGFTKAETPGFTEPKFLGRKVDLTFDRI